MSKIKQRRVQFLHLIVIVTIFLLISEIALAHNSSRLYGVTTTDINYQYNYDIRVEQPNSPYDIENFQIDDPLSIQTMKIMKSNNELIEFEFIMPELLVEDIKAPNGEIYQKLSILEGGQLADIGKPSLPTKGVYIDVPFGTELKLQIKSATFEEEDGYNIYPFQNEDENNEIIFEKNLTAYQTNSFYPSDIADIMDVGIIRGHRTALLIISPVLYNPVQQKIRVYSKISIEINYVDKKTFNLDDSNDYNYGEKYDSHAFQSFFEGLYSNYNEPLKSKYSITNDYDGDLDSIGADYLIITPEQFCDNLIPLVNSKENQGLVTKVANFTETGTTVSDIESYIQNAYDTWDIPPSYLLLVGDSNLLPTKYMDRYGTGNLATDLYYATVDGDDYFPDLFYGRLPIRTDDELDNVIDKILNWENSLEASETWRQTVLLAAYYETGRYFVETSESIRSHLESKGYTCNTVYAPGGTTTDVINYINAGTFFVNHRNHGSAAGWGHPVFHTSHVPSLTNEDKYPVMFSINCESGHFDSETDCLGETILKAQNKGVVAYIGASRGSWSGFNDELNRGFITSIWPDYFEGYTNIAGHSTELGATLNFGKLFMFDKYVLTGGVGSEGTEYPWESYLYPLKTKNTFEMFHLFGDPQLSLIPSNSPFEPYNPKPSNDSTGVNSNVELSVDVFDPNGDLMNISFYNATDNSLIGTDTNISNRRSASVLWSSLSRDTTFYWYANVTDGISTIKSPTWKFKTRSTTEFSTSPIIINEVSTGTDYVELYNYGPNQDMTGWYIEFYDDNEYDITWYFPEEWIFHSNYVVTVRESTGTDTDTVLYTGANIYWAHRPIAVGLFNINTINMDWFQTSTHTLEPAPSVEWEQDITLTLSNQVAHRTSDFDSNKASDWSIPASGSMGSLNPGQTGTWSAPNSPNNPIPTNSAIDVSSNPTLSVDVFDSGDDPMDVYFYNASDDILIGTDYDVSSGGTATVTWLGLSGSTTYFWYAIADDGLMNTISSIWSFTVIDTDPPTWDFVPLDQEIEYGDSFYYDVNASDLSGIDYYWINDTTNFQIDENGLITDTTTLSVGDCWLEVRAYDPYSNYCTATIEITVEDTTDPTWDFVPLDQEIEYGDSFYYDVNASDLSEIDHYWINDTTNFQIDENGAITNAISLSVSDYWLEVRAYDPYSYYCTATIKITVEDTTDPTWDFVPLDQEIEYGDSFYYDVNASDLSEIDYYWINDTTNFQIDENGAITNAISLSAGDYWLEVRAYDQYGNYCTATIVITVEDTTDPTWDFTPAYQTVEYGDSFYYDVNASDLSEIDYYWINDTTNFQIDENGAITNSITLSTGDYWLEVRAYDPYGNYCTATIVITVEDTTDPTWDFVPLDQEIEYGDSFYYDINASDLSEIDHYWINDTTNFQIDENGIIIENVTLSVGDYWLEVRAYDPYNYYCTATIKITVEDTTDPTWGFEPADQVLEYDDSFYYDVDALDLSGIDYYWINDTTNFQIDENGAITNSITLSTGDYWLEVRAYDPYSYYCTATIKITVEDTTDPTWDFVPLDQEIEYGDSFYYDVNASDLSGIDYYWINDTTNFQIDENGAITNAILLSAGDYWLEVRAYDQYGNYCSATIKITVEPPVIPEYSIMPLILILLSLYTIPLAIRKRRK